jgi:hypothetical protein
MSSFARTTRLTAVGLVAVVTLVAGDVSAQLLPPKSSTRVARPQGTLRAVAAAPVRVNLMTTRVYSNTYTYPGGKIVLLGTAEKYFLTDGTQWSSSMSGYVSHWAQLVRVEVSGTTIRYVLSAPEVGLLYEQSDYNGGLHTAKGSLGAAGPLVIEAQAGSATALLRGAARVVSNDPPSPVDPLFNAYSAVVGSVVPFEMVYTLASGTWQPDTFTRTFSYSGTGFVDFANPISTPRPLELTISGPSRVPDEFSTQYGALVRYDSGATRDESFAAAWTVAPAPLASVTDGFLTVGTLPTAETTLTLQATYVQGADSVVQEKLIRCLADDPAEKPRSWPMFQANARHTGYLPVSLVPESFRLRWQKELAGSFALNPVAAGEGKVFATLQVYFTDTTHLFALRSSDGETLWTQGFGSVFSVNPPSYAYGNVYVQTGNHSDDTWLRAFDGDTGAPIFKKPHSAQWEHYFAPTMYDGKAYINGGGYGGMYSFDAYSGQQLWYTTLPQYDSWTPAVDGDKAFAYVGEYTPGLYVKDRLLGVPANYFVPDPNFDWGGWSMNLAPVIGGHDDVIAIQAGRLISFDPTVGAIRWELQGAFTGQPSVAKDRIYAIDGGQLVVLDELTHVLLWSWQAPSGSLTGPMIVTDTHLLASTEQAVYAVDLTSHQSVWSFPVGGSLALADDTLYVAPANGGPLTAISTSSASQFFTVEPCRIVDTRGTSGVPVGGPALQAGVSRTVQIAGNCGVSPTARAVSLNVTVTQPGAGGGLSLYPAGSLPVSQWLVAYPAGRTRSNNTLLSLGSGGGLTAIADQATGTSAHLLIDVTGYFE